VRALSLEWLGGSIGRTKETPEEGLCEPSIDLAKAAASESGLIPGREQGACKALDVAVDVLDGVADG
jgi:hypothetical protein